MHLRSRRPGVGSWYAATPVHSTVPKDRCHWPIGHNFPWYFPGAGFWSVGTGRFETPSRFGEKTCYNPAQEAVVLRFGGKWLLRNHRRNAHRIPQRGPQPPRYIVIEGPLRVGKTTLARLLAERLHARRIYDCEDNPFLADFYAGLPGAAFRTQLYFLMERQKRIREGLSGDAPGLVVSDFLMEKDRIFANLSLDDEELKLTSAITKRSRSNSRNPIW